MPRVLKTLSLVAIAAAFAVSSARAQSSTPPDSIEEDWEVIIATPDPDGAGPQISTAMSPVSDGSTPFFVFDLNYRDYPTFSPGGMQVQIWSGESMLGASTKGTQQCNTVGESITWTQRIRVSSGRVYFAIDSGKSKTWNKFGQGQQLNVDADFATTLTSLATYTPEWTVANSGVGWEPNRVTSMKLLRVRYYAGGKLLRTDSTVRTISLTN
jgi:hypothetical protein